MINDNSYYVTPRRRRLRCVMLLVLSLMFNSPLVVVEPEHYYLFILIDVNTDILDKYSMCRLQMCSDFDSIFYWTLSSKLDLIAGKVIARSVGLMQYSTLPLEDKISTLGSLTLTFY